MHFSVFALICYPASDMYKSCYYFKNTTQKMKFSINNFFNKNDQYAVNCGLGHNY